MLQLIQIFSLENHQHHGEGDHDLDDQDDQDDHDLDSEGNWCRGQGPRNKASLAAFRL